MSSPENPNESKSVTFNEAREYIRWLRKKSKNQDLDLPTLAQLKAAKNTGIYFGGKEWTKEGWVYDPILDKVDKHPKSDVMAFFRVVDNSPGRKRE